MKLAIAVLLVACSAKHPETLAYDPTPQFVAGAFPVDRAPDGNSILLEAPGGLIVIDTGRHTQHQDKLLAIAKRAGKPIAAIVNTHWHLDHSGGNAELRAVYPGAEIIATNAVDGALVGFFPQSRAKNDELIASGQLPPAQLEDLKLGRAAIDDTANLRPTRPITQSGRIEIAGRALDAHVAPFAATEADLWLYDPVMKTAIVGDLVVTEVPFFDSGCPDGWKKALAEIEATPFVLLIPGHGTPMNRTQFVAWRAAFDAWVDCAASTADTATCVARWRTGAAAFIPAGDEARVDEYATYYTDEILRSPAARERFCHPLKAP